MEKVSCYIYANTHDVPVRKPDESDEDFEARMDWFRQHDNRIPIDGLGKVNLGFYCRHVVGNPVLCNKVNTVMHSTDPETGETTHFYEPEIGGTYALPKE